MWEGTHDPLGRPVGSVELHKGPAMALVGPRERGTICGIGSSSFGNAGIVEVGEQWTLFRDCPVVEGTSYLLELGDVGPTRRGVNSLAPWTPAMTRSTSQLAGVPTSPSPATGVPLTPGVLFITSASLSSHNKVECGRALK